MLNLKSSKYRGQVKSSRKKIIEETCKLIKELKRLKKEHKKKGLESMHNYQLLIAGINELIGIYKDWLSNGNTKLKYVASSLFLQESFELLNKKEVESLHFVTGPEIEEIKVLDKIVDFKLEKQSVVYAKADKAAIREALIYLSNYGFRLWGCFHIHPGSGPSSIHPSGTDMTLDRLLNKGGYDCIGAIFSRDGYVRFFSSKDFEINIYGNGVEKINEKLYRLVNVE